MLCSSAAWRVLLQAKDVGCDAVKSADSSGGEWRRY